MEFTEIEKRMLHQTEGTERYAVQQELSMASRYGRPHTIKKGARADLGVPGSNEIKFLQNSWFFTGMWIGYIREFAG